MRSLLALLLLIAGCALQEPAGNRHAEDRLDALESRCETLSADQERTLDTMRDISAALFNCSREVSQLHAANDKLVQEVDRLKRREAER